MLSGHGLKCPIILHLCESVCICFHVSVTFDVKDFSAVLRDVKILSGCICEKEKIRHILGIFYQCLSQMTCLPIGRSAWWNGKFSVVSCRKYNTVTMQNIWLRKIWLVHHSTDHESSCFSSESKCSIFVIVHICKYGRIS